MIKIHKNVIQGTEEWYALRCGLLTASEMKHIISPKKLEYADNDKGRSHLYEMAAQRITCYVEPAYVSDDMLRGRDDEIDAKCLYEEHYARVEDVGFITNDEWGFTLGYSPDGLVGDDGVIECKGRRQKFQIETISCNEMPSDYLIQVQTGLLVSGRKWCDFISYCGGLPVFVKRVMPDLEVQKAIIRASTVFHEKLENILFGYKLWLNYETTRVIHTKRRVEQEISL